MIYKDFQGMKISALGLGMMRLPVIDGDDSRIDTQKATEIVDYAMAHGINYYDTAYGYHYGNSEKFVKEAFKNYSRDSYYLASKFPGYDLSYMDKVKPIFEEQLQRTGADYFDFYLFHNLCEMNIEQYLDDKTYGIYSHLTEQKKNGRIKHLGVSVHGSAETLTRFLDAYGEDIEFCQLQLNWLDYNFQDAKEKLRILKERSIPVWVMEPLRGGKLTSLSQQDTENLKKFRKDESLPGWAFRFLQSIPEVVVTLSGMNKLSDIKQNIEIFSEEKPLSTDEMDYLLSLSEKMTKGVPCTACRYCISHCPQGLDIPRLLSLYNEHNFSGGGFIAPMALSAMPEDKKPSACIGCRSCEQVCPQGIKISEALSDFVAKL